MGRIAGTEPAAHWAEHREPVTQYLQPVFVIRHVVRKSKARTLRAFPFFPVILREVAGPTPAMTAPWG